ncbi:hypothetical protein [Streptomyces sp. FR-008]|uniref:hypothetical protein n=1 Tax=Streptomyces sp. FR-008 TaxID=206662 RepID=UPI000720C9F8|nr:hypothetical protein [Streptomyces sp. FR-008]ALM38228.1 hypothetical protein SFR_1613 [Streptomyces sp. FR-008]KAF0795871.1 hypothetical protein P405_00490 [Streptomyces sp. FR-008]
MPRVYATPEQLAAWTGQPAPADAERLLARASADVDAALMCALYDTNDAGVPTAPHVVQALADATCAQVEYQLANGDDGTGAAGRWGSVSIGPVSLGDRRDAPQAPGGLDLAPRAHRALMAAGLFPGVIW